MNPPAPTVEEDEKPLKSASEPTILFVDDEPRSLKCFRKILSQDFEILTASNAAEATEILETRGSDIGILVADQRMPKTTGVDLIKIVRAKWPHIVPLLATAYIDIDATTRAINEGRVFKYIRKPWDRDQLRAQLHEAAEEYARIRSNAKLAEANRELEHATEVREEFIRTLSHEIRNPINISVNLAEHLLETPLNDEQRQHIASVKEVNDQLANLLDNSLDYSKWSDGKLTLLEADFHLDSILRSLFQFFDLQAQRKNVNLSFSVEQTAPNLLKGDAHRLLQILVNLVGNALKFTPSNGTVAVNVRLVEKSDTQAKLSFSIKDTGIGMSPKDMEQLFVCHAQIQNVEKGAGIGLSITKELVSLMGGEIKVQSAKGEGSEFSFDAVFKLKDLSPPREVRETNEPLRVLVAEDLAVSREFVFSVLSNRGYEIDKVQNGLEALQYAKAKSYSVIILDCRMPVMGGLEASKEISKTALNRKTPLIALTATPMNDIAEELTQAGFSDYIAKPFDPEILIETVEHWLHTSSDSNNT